MTQGHSCLEWQEKRQYERIATNVEARVRNHTLAYANRTRAPGLEVHCQIADLSFVGSRLSGNGLLGLKGHHLELTLLMPDGELFALLGHVVRFSKIQPRGFDVGLRFFRVSIHDQLRLALTLHALDHTMRLQSRPLFPFSRAKIRLLRQEFIAVQNPVREHGDVRDARTVSCGPRTRSGAALPTAGRVQCFPAWPG